MLMSLFIINLLYLKEIKIKGIFPFFFYRFFILSYKNLVYVTISMYIHISLGS